MHLRRHWARVEKLDLVAVTAIRHANNAQQDAQVFSICKDIPSSRGGSIATYGYMERMQQADPRRFCELHKKSYHIANFDREELVQDC
jgi:hypothetical protein